MPYIVKANGAGPWLKDQEVSDADFAAHPFHAKFLRNGSVVQASDADTRQIDPAATTARLAEIGAQIGQLEAERQTLLSSDPRVAADYGLLGVPLGPEPTAPARVTVEIDPQHQPSGAEADATRAAGDEVIEPTPRNVAVGKVVPGEAAQESAPAAAPPKKERK
jgi:hypothetical protein